MATLTQTAIVSKKLFNTLMLIIGLFVISFVAYRYGGAVIRVIFPPPPAPATVAFGKLPRLDLSEGIRPTTQISYTLETISGELPTFTDQLKVFAFGAFSSYFGALEHAKIKVSTIGFTGQPELTGNTAKFVDATGFGRTITIDILNGNFNFDTNYSLDSKVSSTLLPSADSAVSTALGFLSNLDINERDYPKARAETTLYKFENGKLIQVPSISQTNIIQVNFYRADLDNIGVYYPRYGESHLQVLVAYSGVISAQVERGSLEKHKFSTYPLKGVTKAFAELKGGLGAFNRQPESNRFPIRNVTLGYLDNKSNNGYLQPIYVFKSDHDLVAYVSAVESIWINN